jgi:hypothetical protein
MRRWTLFKKRSRRARTTIGGSPFPNTFPFRDPVPPPEAARAFAETVLLCSRQELTATSDDPEYLRNRDLLEQRKFKETNFNALCPLSAQLRSSVLQPSIDIGEVCTESERESAVTRVIALRSSLLAEGGPLDQEQILTGRKGRILIYVPVENVSDGASQVGSLGFFDVNDAPPWDTWIHYSNGQLYCWVPDSFISLAQNGIDANMVQCIQWADQ